MTKYKLAWAIRDGDVFPRVDVPHTLRLGYFFKINAIIFAEKASI